MSLAEALAVFAFARLLTAIPFTPGGLGVIELALITGLAAGRRAARAGRGGGADLPGADLRAADPDRPGHLHLLAAQPVVAAGAQQRPADRAGAGDGVSDAAPAAAGGRRAAGRTSRSSVVGAVAAASWRAAGATRDRVPACRGRRSSGCSTARRCCRSSSSGR